MVLSSQKYVITLVKSEDNVFADVLSPLPVPEQDQSENFDFGKNYKLNQSYISIYRKTLRGDTNKKTALQ